MASVSTKAGATKLVLTPKIILKGHGGWIRSISDFPNGQRMISGSDDRTARQWDLKAGKEIEEVRGICEESVYAVAVSRDGRWVVTGGGCGELKACEVETGIVRKFKGHSQAINCVDISADNTLLASGASDETVRIWNLDTSKLVAGPFNCEDRVGTIRFSADQKKLAVKLATGKSLQVWGIQSQKLDVKVGEYAGPVLTNSAMFWTNNDETIVAALGFTKDDYYVKAIYELDGSTLEVVEPPFEGHTTYVNGLALSSDGALLASTSDDHTIKFWAFESRQLLASFDVQNIYQLILSPTSCQLTYTINNKDVNKICICDTPADVLAQARVIARKKSRLNHLLHSHATRPPAGNRRPPIYAMPMAQVPLPTRDRQQPSFLRLSNLLRFSPRPNTLRSGRKDQSHDPLDIPATLPLPSSLAAQAAPRFDQFEISSPPTPLIGITQFLQHHLSFLAPRHSLGPPVVEVAPGRKFTRLAAAKMPEYKKVDDTRHASGQQATVPQENDSGDTDSLPDVHWCKAFLCYYSCWSHGRLRKPPRWRLERVDIPRQDGTNSSHGGAHGRT